MFQPRDVVGTNLVSSGTTRLGPFCTDHLLIILETDKFTAGSLNVGAPIKVTSPKINLDNARPPESVAIALDECLGLPWREYCDSDLVGDFFSDSTMGSIKPEARPFSQTDRKNDLTRLVLSGVSKALNGQPFDFDLKPSPWQPHHDIPARLKEIPSKHVDVQTTLVWMWIRLYTDVALKVGKSVWNEFVQDIPVEETTGTIISRAAHQATEFFAGGGDYLFLQEFRERDLFMSIVLKSFPRALLVCGDDPTDSVPTVGILVKDARPTEIDSFAIDGVDPRRAVGALVCSGERHPVLLVSFHGDANKINPAVASALNEMDRVIYGGDYQGGKDGADKSQFTGITTDLVGTRLAPSLHKFGFNAGIKAIAKSTK